MLGNLRLFVGININRSHVDGPTMASATVHLLSTSQYKTDMFPFSQPSTFNWKSLLGDSKTIYVSLFSFQERPFCGQVQNLF